MNTSAMHSVHLPLLDAMIARAEAACGRYRRAAEATGLTPYVARTRRQTLKQMEELIGEAAVAARFAPGRLGAA